MGIKVGKNTFKSRRMQRWLHRKGVILGFRKSYREMGMAGLWLACLSRANNIHEAIEMWRTYANRHGLWQ